MKIQEVVLRKIFTSKGSPTLEVDLRVEDRVFSAEVPAGESRGGGEAKALSPEEAQARWDKAKLRLEGEKFGSVRELDGFLVRLDGTKDKSNLGGNVILGISTAFVRALAAKRRAEEWEIIREEFFPWGVIDKSPLIFANFLEGGAHARNNLAFQEYLVVAETDGSIEETISGLVVLYREFGERLSRERGVKMLPIGDEGGYVLDFETNYAPLRELENLIKEKNLAGKLRLGLDAAANHFYAEGKYAFEGSEKSSAEMVNVYSNYFRDSNLLFSIEDPFAESDARGFKDLRQAFPDKFVVGDDLTVTNAARIEEYGKEGVLSAVIIKPNQAGTVTETCAAIHAARKHGLMVIISHRGQETGDAFIIQLAKAAAADGVKIGPPARERILKYNQLLRLYP
jgi:enolase